MMTLEEVVKQLQKHGLYKETVTDGYWDYELTDQQEQLQVEHLSYDSRQIKPGTLFMCKGNDFKPEYADKAIDAGAMALITELVMTDDLAADHQQVPQIIVTDMHKAMAVIARAFYGEPDKELTMIGITGTKGKTTTTYFIWHMLNELFPGQAGRLTSIDSCVDGKTFFDSHLTTPEALDLFRMLRQAADNHLKYLVMEVSSQAYKMSRVYGIKYQYGAFLNISPDHISPVEHPTFDDYLYCKSQLVVNSERFFINRSTDYYDVIAKKARHYQRPLVTFGSDQTDADYRFTSGKRGKFSVATFDDGLPQISGDFQTKIPGDFNDSNATAAMSIVAQINDDLAKMKKGIAETTVPGRMEMLTDKDGIEACVDYAHDYLSFTKAFNYMKASHPEGRLIVVTGSAGGKAESRRADIGKVLSEYADVAILTSEDNFFEDPHKIDNDIKENITNPNVEVHINVDRVSAIKQAYEMAKPGDVIFEAAKGRETFMHDKGHDIPYIGDYQLTRQLMGLDK